jgi:hypothetical protein
MEINKILSYMNIEFTGESMSVFSHCGVKRGILKLPEGANVNGDLIAVGENETYLHCFISGCGAYYGIYKSDDENHLYQHILRLNT